MGNVWNRFSVSSFTRVNEMPQLKNQQCHSCDSGNGIELNGESDHGDDDSDNDWINNGNDESNNENNGNDQYY